MSRWTLWKPIGTDEAGAEHRHDGAAAGQLQDEVFDGLELRGVGQLDREPRPERVVRFDDREVEVGSLDARRRDRGERLHCAYLVPLAGAAVPPLLEPSLRRQEHQVRLALSGVRLDHEQCVLARDLEGQEPGLHGRCRLAAGGVDGRCDGLLAAWSPRRPRGPSRSARGTRWWARAFGAGERLRDVDVVTGFDLVRHPALDVHVHGHRHEVLLASALANAPPNLRRRTRTTAR